MIFAMVPAESYVTNTPVRRVSQYTHRGEKEYMKGSGMGEYAAKQPIRCPSSEETRPWITKSILRIQIYPLITTIPIRVAPGHLIVSELHTQSPVKQNKNESLPWRRQGAISAIGPTTGFAEQ